MPTLFALFFLSFFIFISRPSRAWTSHRITQLQTLLDRIQFCSRVRRGTAASRMYLSISTPTGKECTAATNRVERQHRANGRTRQSKSHAHSRYSLPMCLLTSSLCFAQRIFMYTLLPHVFTYTYVQVLYTFLRATYT